METLEQLRRKLLGLCIGTKLEEEGVHTVTFQPLHSKINEDRVVTKSWDIDGQRWLFLAVCDGEFQSVPHKRGGVDAMLRSLWN
jgi:pyruvate dehydrogenase phosphatase